VATPNEGDSVNVHYTGKLEEDGTVFDTSRPPGESQDADPLNFTLGEQTVIPGFEQTVAEMEPGEERSVTLDPEQAYGPRRDDMVQEVDQDELPDDLEANVGQQLQLRMQNGQTVPVVITEVDEETGQITIDANHPLAGKTLVFDIELVGVEGGEGEGEGESQIVTP
jgi:peptidylprolyl isomerase/FKBP-type peptidyl-prolyl cis-trans isomerase SlpA